MTEPVKPTADELALNLLSSGFRTTPEDAKRLLLEIKTVHAHDLAEKQRAYAEEEWVGSDARMILRRRVARHLADLIDPEAP